MCQTPPRSRTLRRRGAAAAACLSLALAGPAAAADPKALRLVVNGSVPGHTVKTTQPAASAPVDPDPVIGVLQNLQLLLDWVFTGHAAAPVSGAPLAFAAAEPGAAAPGPAEIVPYPGPLAAGTIILNLDRLRVYRVLGGGWAELYQETSEAAVLARIGMAK